MKNTGFKILMIFLLFAEMCGHAEAKSWSLDYTKSKLGFSGMQGSDPFQGEFKKFKADIDFDPANPEAGKISVTVDIGSASTGNGERDSMIPQSDWFDATKFPEAHFDSTQIRKTGDNSYEMTGALTIKGISEPVTLPFTLIGEGDHMHAVGKTTLMRTDFHLGEGQWSNESTVKYGVDVTIDLVTLP